MRHHKMIVFGVVLVLVIVFGFIFWGDLLFTQQELANTPMPVEGDGIQLDPSARQNLSGSDSLEALESDLAGTELDGLDGDLDQLETELSNL